MSCLSVEKVRRKILANVVKKAGPWGADQAITYPLITKVGINRLGKAVHYYLIFNQTNSFTYSHGNGVDLLSAAMIASNMALQLAPWEVKIVIEK